jgi:hypothetical protein
MQRIASKGLLFITIWIVLLATLVAASERVAPIYEPMKLKRTLLQERAKEVEALSLGNSHGQALDFATLGVAGFNFRQGGGDLYEAAFIAHEVVPELPALRCVFVTLSPYSIHADNGAPTGVSRASRRRELYARTLSREYIEGDRTYFILGKLSPLVRDDHWKQVLLALTGRKPVMRIREDGTLIRRSTPRTIPAESLAAHGERSARRHEAFVREVLRVRPSAAGGGIHALEALIGTAAAREVLVILYTPPYHESYLRAMAAGRLSEVVAAGADLSKRYENVVYTDFSRSDMFAGRPDLFADSNHLNADGARMFSRLLAEHLRATRGTDCRAPRNAVTSFRRLPAS